MNDSIDVSKIIMIGDTKPLSTEVKAIPATTVLFGNADTQNELYFMDSSRQFTSGVWERPQSSYTKTNKADVFYYMIEGEIVIQNQYGDFTFIYPGRAYIVPAGFSGQWDVVKFTRQFYARHQLEKSAGA
ncbi:MAG: DUF861 domain-containing protein [Oceanospirillaceae bacterium]|nr:DUF861 domain-containing protein [Oceanospirillaceae bacterium]